MSVHVFKYIFLNVTKENLMYLKIQYSHLGIVNKYK